MDDETDVVDTAEILQETSEEDQPSEGNGSPASPRETLPLDLSPPLDALDELKEGSSELEGNGVIEHEEEHKDDEDVFVVEDDGDEDDEDDRRDEQVLGRRRSSSRESESGQEETWLIRFVSEDGGFDLTLPIPPETSAVDASRLLCDSLQLDPQIQIALVWNGNILAPEVVVWDVASDEEIRCGQLEILVILSREESMEGFPCILEIPFFDENTGELVSVTEVRVDRDPYRKPFLGGYRNKNTGIEYHHASSQTPLPPKSGEEIRKLKMIRHHRDTQTFEFVEQSIQLNRESASQTKRSDLVQDDSQDIVVHPRPYVLADDFLRARMDMIIKIQAWVRGCLVRKRAQQMREEITRRQLSLLEEERKLTAEGEEKRRKEIERRMNPRTSEDFELLYSELEAWRYQETRKIESASLCPEDRHRAMQELLKKETKLLQTIDRLKIRAKELNEEDLITKRLSKMSCSKKWEAETGEVVEVETPFTTRARELMELYVGLSSPPSSLDERLDVLLHVKWTVKEFDCKLTREIAELIDREADMLNRGRKSLALQGLRKRISHLFLEFVETPEFNPEAIRYQRVPIEYMHRPRIAPIVQ